MGVIPPALTTYSNNVCHAWSASFAPVQDSDTVMLEEQKYIVPPH